MTTPARAASRRAAPERATRATRAGSVARGTAARPAITGGARCGWPAHPCGAPDDWHTPPPGTRRPWGWHDRACPLRAADPGLYPQCGLINDHAGPCDHTRRLQRNAS
jgi:hypothetical protein